MAYHMMICAAAVVSPWPRALSTVASTAKGPPIRCAPVSFLWQGFPYLQKDVKKSRNREIGELFEAGELGWQVCVDMLPSPDSSSRS